MSRGQSATPESEKFAKNREKSEKKGKKEEKSGRKGNKTWLCPLQGHELS